MESFEELKELCRTACHERNACKQGFEAMLLAENTAQMMAVWRQNWQDIYESKFADMMPAVVAGLGRRLRREMRQSDVYVNEPSSRGLVIVCQPSCRIRVGGTAKAYVFGTDAEVAADDHAQVYCRTHGVGITLRGYASGKVRAGDCELYDRSFLKGTPDSIKIHDQATYEEIEL